MTGLRTTTYQRPVCSLCERPVFILPANIYPQPKRTAQLHNRSTRDAPSSKSTRRSSKTVVADDSPRETSAPNTVQPQAEPQKSIATEHAGLLHPKRPFLTPLRLIAFGIVSISFVTVAGLWHRHRVESAKVIVSTAADAGMNALREQDFVKAAELLNQASLAVDILGRTDSTANDIRRSSREAMALAKLATDTLTDILQESFLANRSGPSILSSSYKGAWVIFDSQVYPLSSNPRCYVVDAPVQFSDGFVQIEIESVNFKSVFDDTGEPPRVIFAAQLESLSQPTGEPKTAVLTLNGKTVFLWSSYENYTAIGYRPFDVESEKETRSILSRQLAIQMQH